MNTMVPMPSYKNTARFILPVLPVFLAMLALAGWIFDIDALKRDMSSGPNMNPVTAICLILAGFETARSYYRNDLPILSGAGRAALALVMILSIMKLSDVLIGTSFDTDRLLFSNQLSHDPVQPDRMVPNTAICFVLICLSLQFLRSRSDTWLFIAQLLSLFVWLPAMLSIAGYAFDVSGAHEISVFTPMAVDTAISFLCLSGCVLLTCPDNGFMRILTKGEHTSLVTSVLIPAAIFVPFIFSWISFAGHLLGYYSMEFALALTVALNIGSLLLLVYLSARRLYLLDHDLKYSRIELNKSTRRITDLNVANELLQEEIRKREQVEMETRMLLTRYQVMMNTAADGIHVLDERGDVIEANGAFCRMLGYTREEVARLNVADWDMQWSAGELKERIRQFIDQSATGTFETRHRRKDGTPIDVEVSVSGVNFEGGRYVFATSRDITGRKKSDAIMQRHKTVIDTAMDGFVMVDMHGNLLDANEAYAKLSGYTVAELKKMHVSQLEAKEQPAEVAAHIAKIIAQGHDRFETLYRRKDGQVIDVEISVTAVPEVQQFFAFCRDITERKKAEVESSQHKTIIETTNDGFWITDLNGNVLDVNRAYASMMGYKKEELLGMNISSLSLLSPTPELLRSRIAMIINQGVEHFETRHVHKDGHIVDIEVSATYLPETNTIFSFLRDVTERKRTEDALRVAAAAFETYEAIMITDASGNIVRVNQAFQEITGFSSEDVLGKNPRILKSGRHDKAFYTGLWGQLLGAGSWSGEIWDKRKNGEIYPKWQTITAIKNDDGKTTGYVAMFSDISARKKAEEEIRHLAYFDALTKLPNRRLLLDRFNLARSISSRSNLYGALLFLDVDRFKTLNDTLGHDYGDLLLVETALRIQSCVRDIDTVARLGGDEFIVLIEEISADAEDASQKVAVIAEKICAAMIVPYRLRGHEYHSSASIGVCLYRGTEVSADDLLKHADLAMYQAKESGRNAVRFFDPVMQHAVETRAALEADLRSAVHNQQLQLYYQIQVDGDHRPQGAEALVRWIHPERGLVLPAQFIHIAEESSLILELGRWVLDAACKQLALWSKNERTRDLVLAINVSAQQFGLPDFVGRIAATVREHQADPTRLKLELTERVVLNNISDVVVKMRALKELGVRLSMDDFGTGYSSLSYLKQLPLDQLKIDQSFVHDITSDPNDSILVQTIIDMAQNFRLNVIAEGVETEAQLNFLKLNGCMAYQGHLFGQPLPIDEFEASLGVL